MQPMIPFLWFDGRAGEAMQFYTSVFKNSRIESVTRAGDARVDGGILMGQFVLNGQKFIALNGGPHYSFSPAVSFFIPCETQEEIDELWSKLCEDGEPQRCGWLKDKFGLSWQIVPVALGGWLYDPDSERSSRVMEAMLSMVKLDFAGLKAAYDGTEITRGQ